MINAQCSMTVNGNHGLLLLHRELDEGIVGREHGEQRTTFDGIVLLMMGTGIGVMEIASPQDTAADVQIAAEEVKIFRARIRMGGIAHARIQFAKENGVAAVWLKGKELDESADHRQGFPTNI